MQPETTSAAARQQWEKAHAMMKATPPPDGRDYLSHATNLLSFLEGISELHPIAKAVIVSFKTLVMFEQTRRENDARVTAVFLAQTDTMRVLLDVDEIANRRPQRSDADTLKARLEKALSSIQHEIRACGNSIDTYYKESRLVKFWRAQDWKNRILGHINGFNKCRAELQEALSIQVASGVDDLGAKMDLLLVRLFQPKHDWEKELDIKTRQLGSPSSWIQDSNTIQALISVTKDPALDIPTLAEDSDTRVIEFVKSRLEQVQKELELSLDVLCAKNNEWFELKLSFHAQQVQDTVIRSAHMVVETLSGPYGRLYDEDLRELWKEMNWIFCVETKLFTRALFEYYVDRYSISSATPLQGQLKKYAANGAPTSSSSTNFLLISSHPDAWTLEYISQGDRIAPLIDCDNSGFVRISEANSLTAQIPEGYNLPQWYAYLVAGRPYERRVYRRRISLLIDKLTEMQAQVLPGNGKHLSDYQLWIFYPVCHAFWREPHGQDDPYISPELRKSVKEKMIAQDAALRVQLDALKWSVQDESAVRLLFGEEPPETYILSFCTVMLEHMLEISYLGISTIIDELDWYRIYEVFQVMRSVSIKRISELTDQLQDIATYLGGFWSFFEAEQTDTVTPRQTPLPYTVEELRDYLSDIREVLVDFPFLSPTQPQEEPVNLYRFEGISGWYCDRCKVKPAEKRHHCLLCHDFDLCKACYSLPPEEHSVKAHIYQHPITLHCVYLNDEQRRRLIPEAYTILEQVQRDLEAQEGSLNSSMASVGTSESSHPHPQYVCHQCTKSLSLDSTFYACIGHTCRNYFVCNDCAQEEDDPDANAEHRWWHTLLELRKDIIESRLPLESYLPQASEVGPRAKVESEASEMPTHQDITFITDRMQSVIEEKLQLQSTVLEKQTSRLLESKMESMEERMSQLESKMDHILLALKELLATPGLASRIAS